MSAATNPTSQDWAAMQATWLGLAESEGWTYEQLSLELSQLVFLARSCGVDPADAIRSNAEALRRLYPLGPGTKLRAKDGARSPLRSYTLNQLRGRLIPDRELIVAPFLALFESVLLYGPKGHGKSWAALGTAIAGAQGRGARFLNFKADGLGVTSLYVDGEMFSRDIRQRAEDICRTSRLDPGENLFFWTPDAQPDGTPALDLFTPSGREMLEAHIADLEYESGKVLKQVYFDNLATLFHGWDENKAEAWDAIGKWTLELRARKLGNFWVHHSNRAGGHRGSSAIIGTMHAILNVQHPTEYHADMGANFDVKYEYTRAKPAGLVNFNARLEGDNWTVEAAGDVADDIICILVRQGVGPTEIGKQVGKSKFAVIRATERLREAGKL